MRIILVVMVICLSTAVQAQKIIKKIANDVCECLEEKMAKGGTDISAEVEECMQWHIMKAEKDIRKEMGDAFFEGADLEQTRQFGIDIGKELLKDCSTFMDAAVKLAEDQKGSSEDIYAKAQELAEDGQYQEAVKLYSEVIKTDRNQFDYFNLRGVSYFNMGEYYKAISDFYQASEIDPENHLGLYNVAYTIYQLGDYQKAIKVAKEAVAINKYYCSSHNLMGLIYNQLNHNDSAVVAYSKAYACDTTQLTYLYNIAYSQFMLKEDSTALENFKKAEDQGYESYDLYLYMGLCYDNLKQYNKAIEYQSRIINNYEVNYIPYYNRGLVYRKQKNFMAAKQEFLKAYELDSTDLDITEQLVKAYNGLEQYETSLQKCHYLIQQQSDNAEYRDLRAHVYTQLKKYKLAIEDYKMSLQLYPNDCQIHNKLGELYTNLNDKSTAQKHFLKAKDMGCDN